MTREKKQEFSLRISESNRSQLVVIVFDILKEYLKEAEQAYEKGDMEAYREALNHAQPVVSELIDSLDFQYEISQELLRLYKYVLNVISQAMIRKDGTELRGAFIVVNGLAEAFEKVSEQDNSPKLMENTQKVYAGLTYGKNDLMETFAGQNQNRGFLA